MDSANKQSALVAETVIGTTPATPAFLTLRDQRISGTVNRANSESPERRADRMNSGFIQGTNEYRRVIEMPWVRDAATDVLWESLCGGAWTTNVLKAGSTAKSFTLEEKYSAATAPYRRFTGCRVDSLAISFQPGQPGSMQWSCLALTETVATAAISGATYAAPSPYNDPSTLVDILVNSLVGLSTPKLRSFNMTIANQLQPQYAAGSADPYALGFGEFQLSGSLEVYFNAAADYSAFLSKVAGTSIDLTIGAVTNFKDRFVTTVDAWSPNVDDEGIAGVHNVTINFGGKYGAGDGTTFKITRLVA